MCFPLKADLTLFLLPGCCRPGPLFFCRPPVRMKVTLNAPLSTAPGRSDGSSRSSCKVLIHTQSFLTGVWGVNEMRDLTGFPSSVPPSIEDDATAVTAVKMSPVVLPCHVQGRPQPTVTWTKGGAKLSSRGGSYRVLPTGRTSDSAVIRSGLPKQRQLVAGDPFHKPTDNVI